MTKIRLLIAIVFIAGGAVSIGAMQPTDASGGSAVQKDCIVENVLLAQDGERRVPQAAERERRDPAPEERVQRRREAEERERRNPVSEDREPAKRYYGREGRATEINPNSNLVKPPSPERGFFQGGLVPSATFYRDQQEANVLQAEDRMRRWEQELRQRGARLDRLEKAVEGINEGMQAQKNYLRQLEEKLIDRFGAIKRQEFKREEGVDRLNELREKIERQSMELNEREAMMDRKAGDIERNYAEFAEMKEGLGQRLKEIEEREVNLEEQHGNLAQQEGELARWENELGQRDEELNQRDNELNERDRRSDGRNEEMRRNEENLERRNQELNQREEKVEQWSRELEERSRNMEERERDLQRRQDELNRFAEELNQREGMIQQRKDEMRGRDNERREREYDDDDDDGNGAARPILAVIAVLLLILWIWCLQDCLKKDAAKFPGGGANEKVVWMLVLILTLFLGALLYVFLVQGRSKA